MLRSTKGCHTIVVYRAMLFIHMCIFDLPVYVARFCLPCRLDVLRSIKGCQPDAPRITDWAEDRWMLGPIRNTNVDTNTNTNNNEKKQRRHRRRQLLGAQQQRRGSR